MVCTNNDLTFTAIRNIYALLLTKVFSFYSFHAIAMNNIVSEPPSASNA